MILHTFLSSHGNSIIQIYSLIHVIKVTLNKNTILKSMSMPICRIQNATVKENITFGRCMGNDLYLNTLQVCGLVTDLDMLPGADQTELGFAGINLSGGQKQRISIARAVYSNAQLVLFDDPLSSVDPSVGRHLFEEVIGPNGILKEKTRIVVIHDISLLSKFDHIIVLRAGKILVQGSLIEITQGLHEEELMSFLSRYQEDNHSNEQNLRENLSCPTSLHNNETCFDANSKICEKECSFSPEAKIISEESIESGQVSLKTYFYYLKRFGFFPACVVIVFSILCEGLRIGSDYWLNIWSDSRLGDARIPEYRTIYLVVYGILGLMMTLMSAISDLYFSLASLTASSNMHHKMLQRIMKCPLSFFDTTPLGRIMNRFSTDISVCDSMLPESINDLISLSLDFIGNTIVIMTVIPLFCAVIIPFSIIFVLVGWMYVRTARQLRRIVSISRSPIYSHFSECLSGSSTIRAYSMEERFIKECEKKIDYSHACSYPRYISVLS